MSWDGIVFAHLPDQNDAVPAGRLSILEEGLQSVGSTYGYGARYLQRVNAIPVDPEFRNQPIYSTPALIVSVHWTSGRALTPRPLRACCRR